MLGGAALAFFGGGDELGDALGLCEGEFVVEVGASGELAGFGSSHAGHGQQRVHDPLDEVRVSGQEQLGGILAGVGARRLVVDDEYG